MAGIDIYEVNRNLQIPDDFQENFIYAFYPKVQRLSVTFRFLEDKEKKREYYGLPPSFSTAEIKKRLFSSESPFSNIDAFEKYVNEWLRESNYYDIVDKELIRALVAKTVIAFADPYFVELKVAEACLQEFIELLSSMTSEYMKSFVRPNKQKNGFEVHFFMPRVLKTEMDKRFSLHFNEEEKCFAVCPSWDNFGQVSWEDIEQNKEKYLKCHYEFYYNGVNFRVLHVNDLEGSSENPKFKGMCLDVARTTFATYCGFKHSEILDNYLLAVYKERLIKLSRKENGAIASLLKDVREMSSYEDAVTRFNVYLKNSVYPHTINVSGNIATSDGYLILTRRGNTLDSDQTYCSVNGVAEIYDENVDFYRESVEEDKPSIIFGESNYRNDFSGELSRESNTELGFSLFNHNWQMYGFAMMGKVINEGDSVSGNYCSMINPLHINILAENETSLTLGQIETLRHNAVEEKENKEIFGNHILIWKNILSNWRHILYEGLGWVLNYRDLIIGFILAFFALCVQRRVAFTVMDCVFYIIAVTYICIQLFMNHDRFLYYKTTIILLNYPIELESLLCHMMNKKGSPVYKLKKNAHGIALIMIILYYLKRKRGIEG